MMSPDVNIFKTPVILTGYVYVDLNTDIYKDVMEDPAH